MGIGQRGRLAHHPLGGSEQVRAALEGPAAFLHRAEPLPARVAIVYNRQSLVLGAIDSGDRVMLSLLGCHRACASGRFR